MKQSLLLSVLIAALVTACRGENPTEPVPSATQNPARGGTAAPPESPGTTASLISDGVYYVSAPISGFDPAWGDWTGYSYATVIHLYHAAANPSILSGEFTDFQLRDATGHPEDWRTAGTLTGHVAESGRLTLELVSFDRMFSWSATGDMADSMITGSWGHAHFYGHFVAGRNPLT